ncbi:MAG TPA: protein kinase [bacterium]
MQTGTILSQRYRVERKLGEGGMGVVYSAHDTLLHRPVAIKTLAPSFLGPDGPRRFLREAQAVARLNHPHIVSIYDAIEEGGTFAIVMELVEGKTLRELMPVSVERLLDISAQALQGLEFAHSQGIIHRDIKPENIIITADGKTKLMDFGLARSEGRSRLTQPGMIVGTVAYLAPEQALGGQVDARSDLYSLGAVLYEAVTGKPPFESEDPVSVITQHINVPPVAPHWHNPAVPPNLENLILKLLAKDPGRRYQTAGEVLAALSSIRVAGTSSVAAAEKLTGPGLVQQIAHSPLVGRDAELGRLRDLVEAAVAGRGGVALISGPLGIGKTRLVEDVITFARLRGAAVVSGKAYESAPPYEPFARALRDLARGIDSDTLASRLGDAAPELVALIPELARQLPRIGTPAPGSPEDRKNRLFAGVAQFLGTTAAAGPVVLFLDDMHLADAATVELLQHVARRADASRVLLVVAYRPDEVSSTAAGRLFGQVTHSLSREEFCTAIALRPLTEEQVIDLIRLTANHRTRPVVFGRRIFEATEGNPYFIEEVIKGLFEQGALYIKDGQWSTDFDDVRDYSMLSVPSSVHSAVEARLRTLNDPTRQTLTSAAVIGKQFGFDTLLAAAGTDETTLLDRVEEALRAQLIREVRGVGEDTYEFAQPMLRQVLYDSIPRRRRRLLHRQVGEALERLAAKDATPYLEALALHFGEAEDPERVLKYARLAAEKARAIFAYDSAIAHLQQAVAATEDLDRPDVRVQLLEELGDICQRVGRIGDTYAAYEDAVQLWKSLPASSRFDGARLYRKLGELARWGWYNPRTREHITAGLQLLAESPEHPERIKLLIAQAFDYFWLKPETETDYVASEASAKEAYRLAEAAGLSAEMSAALDALAGTYWQTAEFPKMLSGTERRLALADRLDDPVELVDMNYMLARAHMFLGNYPEALRFGERGYDVAKRSGSNVGLLHGAHLAAETLTLWNRWDEAEQWFGRYDEHEEKTGGAFGLRRRILGLRAHIAAIRGQRERAKELAAGIGSAPTHPTQGVYTKLSELFGLLPLADPGQGTLVDECLRLAGAPVAKLESQTLALEFAALNAAWKYVEEFGEDTLERARRSGARLHLAMTCRALGAWRRDSDRLDEADALLREAQDLFLTLDCPWQQARTIRELALLRRAQGRKTDAASMLRDALTRFESLGAVLDIERTRALM